MGEGWVAASRFAAVALGLPLVTFAFGWSVLGLLTRLPRTERFAASWGVGAAFLAAAEFAAFAAGADQVRFNLATLVFMLAVVVLARFRGRHPGEVEPADDFRAVVVLWGLGYAELACTQVLLPNYMGSLWYGDWRMHYEEALVFRGVLGVDRTWANGYTLASRTPLFNLAGASVMSLAGDDFGVFQFCTALWGSCFLPAVYLVLRDLFGPRAGRLGMTLAPLNLWLLHNAWFTWPKMLTAYFLLLGLHFYVQSVRARVSDPRRAARHFLAFWACGFCAFMTHQSAAVYVAALALHAAFLAVFRPAYRPRAAELAALPVIALAFAGPWYGWLLRTFGPGIILSTTPVTLGETNATWTPLSLLGWVSFNVGVSVAPLYLWNAAVEGPRTPEEFYFGLTALYFSLFTGAMTLSLSAYLLVRLFGALGRGCRGFSRRGSPRAAAEPRPGVADWPEWSAVWFFAILGGLGAAALHPGKIGHGIAHSACYPTTIVLVALAWGLLSRAPRRWAAVVSAGIVAEFLLMYWSHCWLAVTDPVVLDSWMANASYKREAGAVFLNDRLDAAAWVFVSAEHGRLGAWPWDVVAATAAIQMALCGCLARWLREQPPNPGGAVSPSPGPLHSP
jgi:hypothetical protein